MIKSETLYLISILWMIGAWLVADDLFRLVGMMLMSVFFFIGYLHANKIEFMEKMSELGNRIMERKFELRRRKVLDKASDLINEVEKSKKIRRKKK